MNLIKQRKKINELLSDHKTAKKNYRDEGISHGCSKIYLSSLEEARVIAQTVAQTVQQQAHNKISNVVTKCLQTVFNGKDRYSFKINFERKRGRTEADLILIKNGHEISDPLTGDSGGVVDIAAFALRISCLILSKPTLRRVVLLDEPFKYIDIDNRENAKILLETLSKDLGIQFIMVTHDDEFKIGKVIKL